MIHRRQFLTGVAAAVGAVAADAGWSDAKPLTVDTTKTAVTAECCGQDPASLIDFRYAPKRCQHTFCFPEDPYKGVVGERGDLRYGRPVGGNQDGYFPGTAIEFSLSGMGPDLGVRQWIEGPGVPIIHTQIERAEAYLDLTAFASNEPGEGRVDNVIAQVRPRDRNELHACMLVNVRAKPEVAVKCIGRGQRRAPGR